MNTRDKRAVWIVDDSALDAERARRALADDYEVRTFSDGTTVLEALGSSAPPDVLVLDWVMPELSGLDICRFIRSRRDRSSRVAVLLLTAHQRPSQVVEGLKAGADEYLSKPYAPEELCARVGALVRSIALVERAEAAEATVKDLLASVPDALLVLDPEQRITYASTEAGVVLGRPVEALLGCTVETITPELSRDLIACADCACGPCPLPDVTIRGEIFSPTLRVFPADGRKVLLALRNVTQRRRAEARRLDFYSIIAHDLRSPLSAMSLRLELLARGKRGPVQPEAIADLLRLQGTIRTLVTMINDFLDLASLSGTEYRLVKEEIGLSSLVENTVEELRPLLTSGAITVDVQRDLRPTVLADRRRLSQVVANLLSNAIKFTPGGGNITVRFAEAAGYVETTVEDTGPGIAPEMLPTLFQRYTKGEGGGTGLGLMIVREVVEAHGGTVGVASEEGAGSRFWFRLPAGNPRLPANGNARPSAA
ncbi:MAG: ATP-binding protein [Minicystis sp.]